MLTLQLEAKDATCDCVLCERANSHGTRDFMANMDQLVEFHNTLDSRGSSHTQVPQ